MPDVDLSRPPVSIVQVGVHGYGAVHLDTVAALVDTGSVRLLGLVDPAPAGDLSATHSSRAVAAAAQVPWHASLSEALNVTEIPDIVIIATPIHTHAQLAALALEAGCHVLLEKPPTVGLAEYAALQHVIHRTGRQIQVGFQCLGSGALMALRAAISRGELGRVHAVGAVGAWARPEAYYQRSSWAGKRTLGGVAVVDGALTNPFAHAVMAALTVAGAQTPTDITTMTLDQYRVNDIDCDDTSSLVATTSDGVRVAVGVTVAAEQEDSQREEDPSITVYAEQGTATWWYTTDRLEFRIEGKHRVMTLSRTNLLANLVDHILNSSVPLLSPLAATGAFTRVVDAVRAAPDPRLVPTEYVTTVTDVAGPRRQLQDAARWCRRVAAEQRTFRELGAPWARSNHGELAVLTVAGVPVAEYVDGAGSVSVDMPRPHLHPVRTRSGVTITEEKPADHSWHTGVSLAIPHIALAGEQAWNLWGGNTYRHPTGYQALGDQGQQLHREWVTQSSHYLRHRVDWVTGTGTLLLAEDRHLSWDAVGSTAWQLRWDFTLMNPHHKPITLASPGARGRPGAGYGGFFWRFPPAHHVEVWTEHHQGEQAVQGTRAPWLAWSACSAQGTGYTVVFRSVTAAIEADPWFVRVAEYPAVGSAVAFDTPVVLPPGQSLSRELTMIIADGQSTTTQVMELIRTSRLARVDAAL